MKNVRSTLLLALLMVLGSAEKTLAWGKTGHELTARVAYSLLDDSTRKIVQQFLGKTSFEEASVWMDEEKSNSYYNYMRTWHYVDFEKNEKYVPSLERNALTVLHSAITELKNYKTNGLSKKDIKYRILLIFHIVGDIHQPLHCGYGSDRGGNSVNINSPYLSGNLHSVWDGQILDLKKVNFDTCMKTYARLSNDQIAGYRKINELKWIYESRVYLDGAYDFKSNYLDMNYIDKNIEVIKTQLVIGGIRLASVLEEIFNPKNNS
jgi:hypothetical protein